MQPSQGDGGEKRSGHVKGLLDSTTQRVSCQVNQLVCPRETNQDPRGARHDARTVGDQIEDLGEVWPTLRDQLLNFDPRAERD